MIDRIWLTYKQHRFETVAVTIMCLVAAAWALIDVWRLNSIGVPTSCLEGGTVPYWNGPDVGPSYLTPTCQLASQRFTEVISSFDVRLITSIGDLLPFVVGIVMGAPLVAREIETGTAPLSWALAGSRGKWLAGKLVAGLLLIVPLLLVAGLAADALRGAQAPGVDPHASFTYFTSRGVFFALWGVATMMGTVALSTLKARTLPVVILALLVCALARGTWEPLQNTFLLRGMAVVQAPDATGAPGALLVGDTKEMYLDGKVWQGDVQAWWNAHTTCVTDAQGTYCSGPDTPGPQQGWYVVTGDHYWPVVALESAIMLAGSAVFGAFALFWVGRRRPY